MLDSANDSWSLVQRFVSGKQIHFFGPDLTNPDTIYVGDYAFIYRSIDGGQSFERIESPVGYGANGFIGANGSLVRIPLNEPHGGRIVIGDLPYTIHTADNFVYSDDGGDTWTRTQTSPYLWPYDLVRFASGRIVSAGYYGAVLSDDDAETFQAIPALYVEGAIGFDLYDTEILTGYVTGEEGDSDEGRLLISGTQGGASGGWFIWASDDEGETWQRYPEPGAGQCNYGVSLVPLGMDKGGEPGWVVAVTCKGIVLVSGDGAETWTEIGRVPGVDLGTNPGTGVTSAETAEVGPDGRLYVGTIKTGNTAPWSYRTRDPVLDMVRVAVSQDEHPPTERPALTANPNPARQRVELALTGVDRQLVEIVVSDALGREVARGEISTTSSWRLDVGGWAPGVYHARIAGAPQREAVRFTVVR